MTDVIRRTTPALRLDIQGLRAVAVGTVLLYHSGVPFLHGGYVGVDVFFVISGFLITGLLIREIERSGRIDLRDFWARRARRILPAAAITLLLVAVLTFIVFPITRWASTGIEIAASAAYVVNWVFAVKSTDYLAGDDASSPVQHFWSLAVEEQFYILWPTILVLLIFAGSKRRRRVSPQLLVGIVAAVFIAVSLGWSIYQTASAPSEAYFSTTTRLWELAIGALLAAIAPSLRRAHSTLAAAGAWLGLAGIVVAALVFNESTAFPGYAAALPVVGAALVIGLGEAAGTRGPVAILATKPAVWIGDRSYSIYLFHWPLIVFAFAITGEATLWVGLAAAAVSLIPAALSYTFVERPFLAKARIWRRPTRTSLLAGAALTLSGVLLGGSLLGAVKFTAPGAPDAIAMLHEGQEFGALAAAAESPDEVANGELLLGPVAAADDFNTSCPSTPVGGTAIRECNFGPESGTKVLVVGDSKMRQWIGALRVLADEQQWNVTTILKDSCPYISGPVSRAGAIYSECGTWNEAVRDRIAGAEFDRVITSNNLREGVGADGHALADGTTAESIQSIADGLNTAWHEFTDRGVPVTVLSDGPNMGFDVPDCVATPFRDAADCAVRAEDALAGRGDSQRIAAEGNPLVNFIDVPQWLCVDGIICPAVIGGVVVYLDASHITNTYAISLVPALREALRLDQVGELST